MNKAVKERPIPREVLEMAAECLRTLAHPVRLRIVELLLQGQYTVGELAEECGIRPNVASEHLRLMEMCGLLTKEREGRRKARQGPERAERRFWKGARGILKTQRLEST